MNRISKFYRNRKRKSINSNVEFKGIKIVKHKSGFLKWEKEFEIELGKL